MGDAQRVRSVHVPPVRLLTRSRRTVTSTLPVGIFTIARRSSPGAESTPERVNSGVSAPLLPCRATPASRRSSSCAPAFTPASRTVSLPLHGTGSLLPPPPPPGVFPCASIVDRELPAGPPLPHASASAVPITNACHLIRSSPQKQFDSLHGQPFDAPAPGGAREADFKARAGFAAWAEPARGDGIAQQRIVRAHRGT